MEQDKEERDGWSEDGRIFYHYSKAYAVTESLRTVCLGDRDEIIKKYPIAKKARRW